MKRTIVAVLTRICVLILSLSLNCLAEDLEKKQRELRTQIADRNIYLLPCSSSQKKGKREDNTAGQGHVIVKPNLLIFKLLAGYGYLFLDYATHSLD